MGKMKSAKAWVPDDDDEPWRKSRMAAMPEESTPPGSKVGICAAKGPPVSNHACENAASRTAKGCLRLPVDEDIGRCHICARLPRKCRLFLPLKEHRVGFGNPHDRLYHRFRQWGEIVKPRRPSACGPWPHGPDSSLSLCTHGGARTSHHIPDC